MELSREQISALRSAWPLEGEITFHRRVANFVYFATLNQARVVVRLTEHQYRGEKEIESELDWVHFLREQDLPVASPIAARSGKFVEKITDEKSELLAAVFHFAPGTRVGKEHLTLGFFESWGALLGKMHQATRLYQPPPGITPRPQWNEDANLKYAESMLSEAPSLVAERYREHTEWLKSLDKDPAGYGLIHHDLHDGNFHVEKKRITAFDFDDCCYHWFTQDLVVALVAAERLARSQVPGVAGGIIRDWILQGYLRAYPLPARWVKTIPRFDQYRAAYGYLWYQSAVRRQVLDAKGVAWVEATLPELMLRLKPSL